MTRIWNKHKQIHPVRNGTFSNGANTPLKRKVFVAMSGGVDSSVAAALLKQHGYNVVGVYFKPWSPGTVSGETADSELSGFTAQTYCNWKQDRLDAMRVAAKLGISFQTWDFSKEYGKKVAQYMIDGYRAGITPNPDVMCNKKIKFGLFLKKALAEGANYIATGHYARVLKAPNNNKHQISNKSQNSNFKLQKAKDKNKDQTYFLWTLTQEQLQYCLFPIGDYTKPHVRRMAKKFGLPTAGKKDSQGVCFVGELNMKDFLETYIKPKQGNIILQETGAVVGAHNGAGYYTIGQRHGMDITTGGGPYFVIAKDMKQNILYVTTKKSNIKSQILKISKVNWITEKPKLPINVKALIRYRTQAIPVVINPDYTLSTAHYFTAPSHGQSVVMYQGDEVLGGGIIT